MIPDTIQSQLQTLERNAFATMLFGSYARGDHGPESDLDVLQIVGKPTPVQKLGTIVVSHYTVGQLSHLASRGSLFVLHLRMEGVVLHDPDQILQSALQRYVAPNSYEELISTISISSAVLHLTTDVLSPQQLSGVISLGLYLLRTLIYVRCVEKGRPAFSLVDVKRVLGDCEALSLMANRRTLLQCPTPESFEVVRASLETWLGHPIQPLGSELEAVAVNATAKSAEAGKFITRILLGDSSVHYDTLVEDEL